MQYAFIFAHNKGDMYKAVKWISDRFFSLVALVVTAPLFLAITIAVILDSPGSPFLVQKRDGYKRKTIKVIKFRTMYSANVAFDPDHPVISEKDGNVTRVGRFLRRFKLDEMPQLINVLKGDMSFVGPRPLLPVYTPRYARWEFQKFAVKPGLTGLSQVRGNGYLSVKSRSYYDVLYTENLSLATDLKELFLTIGVIFKGEKAFLREVPPAEIDKMIARYERPNGITRVAEVVSSAAVGGVRTVLENYLQGADKQGLEIHLFTCGKDGNEEFFRSAGWEVHRLPGAWGSPAATQAFRRELQKQRFDVVHSHLTSLSVFPLAVAKEQEVGVRLCHAHSMTSVADVTAPVKNLLKHFAPLFATRLIACSESAAKWAFGKRGAEKSVILKNAFDLDSFAFDPEIRRKMRRELFIPAGTLVMGCVARLSYQKNIPLLLKVASILWREIGAHLILVGGGKGEKNIRRRIRKMGLSECVHLITDCDAPARYYHAMDVFVLTSRFEGLGIAAIEAQANGLPCVLSSFVPREAAVGEQVVFAPIKARAFAAAVRSITLGRRDNRDKLAAAGYDLKDQKDKLFSLYREGVSVLRAKEEL